MVMIMEMNSGAPESSYIGQNMRCTIFDCIGKTCGMGERNPGRTVGDRIQSFHQIQYQPELYVDAITCHHTHFQSCAVE